MERRLTRAGRASRGASKKRYGDPLPDKVTRQIRQELALIQELGHADYFLTVWDIVEFARKKKILCQGRGGAANSIVCFVLGITAVDTNKRNLAISAPVTNEDAVGNLFEDFAGEAQGVAKYTGTFPPTDFTKLTLVGFGRGHDAGGTGHALVSFKVTASGVFEQTP